MRKKQLVILLIVLAAIVGIILGVTAGKKVKAKQEEKNAEESTCYVNQFDTSQVTAFTYMEGEQLSIYNLDNGVWSNMSDASVKLDTEKIESFLTEMSQMTANKVIENVEDNSEYGIDQPAQMFAVVLSDGSSLTYLFGSENDMVGGIYVQVTSDADSTNNQTVYLVDSGVANSTLSKSVDDFKVSE